MEGLSQLTLGGPFLTCDAALHKSADETRRQDRKDSTTMAFSGRAHTTARWASSEKIGRESARAADKRAEARATMRLQVAASLDDNSTTGDKVHCLPMRHTTSGVTPIEPNAWDCNSPAGSALDNASLLTNPTKATTVNFMGRFTFVPMPTMRGNDAGPSLARARRRRSTLAASRGRLGGGDRKTSSSLNISTTLDSQVARARSARRAGHEAKQGSRSTSMQRTACTRCNTQSRTPMANDTSPKTAISSKTQIL